MLFYNQLKKEFSPTLWKKGQEAYRANRVRDVRLDGHRVSGVVLDGPESASEGASHETQVTAARGTIDVSECSCRAHGSRESHCAHVAALCIWVVERGSLLRLGKVGLAKANALAAAENDASASEEDSSESSISGAKPKKKSVPAEPMAFVRGIIQDRALTAVSVEPALRFVDPAHGVPETLPIARLVAHPDALTWKTVSGVVVKARSDEIPFIGHLNAGKLVFQGSDTLDKLAELLSHPDRSHVSLHETVDIEVDPDPLRLVSMKVGRRTDKTRLLTYEFANRTHRFPSDELKRLSGQGRLADRWLWHGNKLYRFEVPLSQVSQYVNRSGVAAPDGSGTGRGAKASEVAKELAGYGQIYDDGDEHALHPLAMYRLQLELGVENVQIDPEWKEYHEWLALFEKTKIPAMPQAELGYELRDYQTNGLTWLWSLYQKGLAGLLADDMGLGKTHQVLALLSTLYRRPRNRPQEPTLVVAPTSVVAAWVQKLNKYDTGLKWIVFHGNQRKIPPDGSKDSVQLVLTTYGMLQREGALRERSWHLVILDEAQAVKNATTISSRTARMLKSRFRIAMTGTPIENQSTDLWSIMEFLLPGYLGSLPRFKRLYGSGRESPTESQAKALKRLVTPFLLRRTKAQVLRELPEKTEELIECQLTQAQRKAYRQVLSAQDAVKVREDIEKGAKIDYANVLALLTRLKQICDHPHLASITGDKVARVEDLNPEDTGKWEAFSELIREALASDLKVVIFTQYLGMIDIISHWLKSQGVGHLDLRGDTQDRAERLDRFANDPECRVFVCSLLAGGLGIDLTAASVCIHFDRWWNPAKENQATDRLHRIGQTRGVQVFKLQIPGTVEDRIAEIIRSKLSLSGTLIEESSLGLKAFSREDLLSLLTLPPDGVGGELGAEVE